MRIRDFGPRNSLRGLLYLMPPTADSASAATNSGAQLGHGRQDATRSEKPLTLYVFVSAQRMEGERRVLRRDPAPLPGPRALGQEEQDMQRTLHLGAFVLSLVASSLRAGEPTLGRAS